MNKIRIVMRTLWGRFLLFILAILLSPFILVACCLPQKWVLSSGLYRVLTRFLYSFVCYFSGVPIEIVGKENIPENPAIIVANHQSSLDIPLVGHLLGGHAHVWFALKSLLKSIVFRFLFPPFAIFVDMSTSMTGMRSLMKAIKMLQVKPYHCIVFPEGGRFSDGKIHEFYSGFAILAKKLERPVMPVYLHNVQKVYSPNSFLIREYKITIVIGEPFCMHIKETEDQYKNRVHAWFVQQEKKYNNIQK